MTDNKRLSNIELLRIISIFLVFVVHASFRSIGIPSSSEILLDPLSAIFRFTSESISIICVNVFVFISGWFSIKPKLHRLCELLFQVLFIWLVIYIFMALYGKTNFFCTDAFVKLFTYDGYWFVRAYIILYIFSPILNSFIENSRKNVIKTFLILFYAIQTLFGFVISDNWFNNGYSPLSFMGLYILARYLHIYSCSKFYNIKFNFGLYLFSIIILDVVAFCISLLSNHNIWKLYCYSSPLVILLTVCFFCLFVNINLNSKFINWIAVSCFSVYLLHTHPLIFDNYYLSIIYKWFVSESRLYFLLYSFSLIILFFSLSIAIDKIRLFIWKSICKCFHFLKIKYQ